MKSFLKYLINPQNEELWNSLNNEFNIELTVSHEPNYLINFKNDQIKIYIDPNDLTPSSFTHELLHIEMKKNGKNIGKHIDELIQKNEQLHYIFSIPLRDHIGNCLEHVKMLPRFIQLGFKNSDFISDFTTKKMTNSEWSRIKNSYSNNKIYDKNAIDYLIGKYFGMKACNNNKYNYSKYFQAIKKLDSTLSKLLGEFWNDWSTFDAFDKNDSYIEIIELFIDDLNAWQRNKSII